MFYTPPPAHSYSDHEDVLVELVRLKEVVNKRFISVVLAFIAQVTPGRFRSIVNKASEKVKRLFQVLYP